MSLKAIIAAETEHEETVVITEEGSGEHAATEGAHGAEPTVGEFLLPALPELVVAGIAFLIVLIGFWKFVLPPLKKTLEERNKKIQGSLEEAEQARSDAQTELAEYRKQLAGAREESNRIIEEARKTAEQLRKDLQTKAEQEAQATVAKAQEEIRAERDRAMQDLKAQVGEIAVDLAGRVVGSSLDKSAHEKLIDDYIAQVSKGGANPSDN